MSKGIFFKSARHQQRFLATMQQIGKIYGEELDPEYAAALYILTADAGTWQKAREYVSRQGIDIQVMLEEVDFSSGYIVLMKLAGNLFNNQQHLDPLEFLRLDDHNFHLALTALIVRRSCLHVDDFDSPTTKENGEHEEAQAVLPHMIEQDQHPEDGKAHRSERQYALGRIDGLLRGLDR